MDKKRSRKSVAAETEDSVDDDDVFQPSEDEQSESDESEYEPEARPAKRSAKEGKVPAEEKSSKIQQQVADRLRKSLATSIKAQMVFKKSLKYGSSRINVEIPNLKLTDLEGILGPGLVGKASKGPKQVTVTTSGDDLRNLFGVSLRKGLRYGADLVIKDEAMKFTYNKETQILKATAACVMIK